MLARILFRRRPQVVIDIPDPVEPEVVAPPRPPEPQTLTAMLQAQIADLGGPKMDLDREMWAETAARVSSAAEVGEAAERIGMPPLLVRTVFAQRTQYVQQAAAMFG